ncbi:proton-coupled folate transporter [Ceratitis capitata]|uniref:(Mediterranean fruit fly) hypothetical protein n=1 Tax=Ceratitis capitata TaxID=7213 RepID=A0A811VH20_CERCA|nr:proton-coupled folate transporter [Ceratitis capitata]CAD7014371.1 unnamed protein product [Ceratitis capitata]
MSLKNLNPTTAEKSQDMTDNSSDSTGSSNSEVKKRFTVIEPAVFLIYISTTMASAVLQNQQLYLTCTVVYDYSDELCEPMLGIKAKNEASQDIETKIQPYVANIIMAGSLITSILPAILSLLLGPWSDKFGRRPVLIATFAAAFIGHATSTILTGISMATPLNPWVYVLSNIPLTVTGGTCALITMVFCLVSDVSDEDGKVRRMFFIEGAVGIGSLGGNLISSYILSAIGVNGVFLVSSGMDLAAFLFVYFFITESLNVKHERQESRLREFFKFGLIKDLVRSCLKRRPHFDRAVIWCIIFTMITTTFVQQGEGGVSYLFLRNKFNVTLQDFTTLMAAGIVIKMIGCGLVLVLLRVLFKAPLLVVSALGILGCFTEDLMRTLAQQFWQMYLATACGFMAGINNPMLQAVLASLVEATEIGKVYAVISALQTLAPLAASPIYTSIYKMTLVSNPAAFYYLSCAIYLIGFLLIGTIYIFQRMSINASRSPIAA